MRIRRRPRFRRARAHPFPRRRTDNDRRWHNARCRNGHGKPRRRRARFPRPGRAVLRSGHPPSVNLSQPRAMHRSGRPRARHRPPSARRRRSEPEFSRGRMIHSAPQRRTVVKKILHVSTSVGRRARACRTHRDRTQSRRRRAGGHRSGGRRCSRPGLGLDSIDALELALEISKRYGFQLRSDDENNLRIFRSLRSLAAHIERQPHELTCPR